jgi:hypothetical protein
MSRPELTDDVQAAEEALETVRRHMTDVSLRERWGRTLIALGVLHFAFFAICQVVMDWPDHKAWHHVALWYMEVGAILVLLRKMNGRMWFRKSPMAGIIVRVWASFLIIDFGAATLNYSTGIQDFSWFKLSWTGLSTFGFAVTAWLMGPRFLIPAVQMYFTGLVIARYPRWAFLIYGTSWLIALLSIGVAMERERSRRLARTGG